MEQSKFLGLNLSDIGKGVLMAFIAAFLTATYAVLANGGFPTKAQWIGALQAAITSSVAYILKNVFTNSDGQFAKKEQ